MPWPHGIREAATAIIIPWDGGLGVSYTSPPQPAGSARTSSCRSWQAPGSSHSERLLLGSPFELSLRRRRSPLPGNGISRAEKKSQYVARTTDQRSQRRSGCSKAPPIRGLSEGRHDQLGNFNRHFWGELLRYQQLSAPTASDAHDPRASMSRAQRPADIRLTRPLETC
jgi:hypothetical protein